MPPCSMPRGASSPRPASASTWSASIPPEDNLGRGADCGGHHGVAAGDARRGRRGYVLRPASWRLRPETHERHIQIPKLASTRPATMTATRPTSRARRPAQRSSLWQLAVSSTILDKMGRTPSDRVEWLSARDLRSMRATVSNKYLPSNEIVQSDEEAQPPSKRASNAAS
jgi:hypothetical protein